MGNTDPESACSRQLDFTDFAQEFLRRNRIYRRHYAALGRLANINPLARECRDMARCWGLRFPDRSQPGRRPISGDMDARCCPLTDCPASVSAETSWD